MDNIFNLHFDMSGSSGSPMSSRHMNRSQARQVIRDNIINNCILHRNDEGFSDVIFRYIADIEDKLGHTIQFHVSIDECFENNMGLTGASYWFREFENCITSQKLFGTEATPSKTDGIMRVSMVLLSKKPDLDYHILWDEDFCQHSNPKVFAQNAILIDELDKYHNMLGALVDGYMFAQGIEKQVELEYNNDPNRAIDYLGKKAIDKYGYFGDEWETKILDNGIVAIKQVEDS